MKEPLASSGNGSAKSRLDDAAKSDLEQTSALLLEVYGLDCFRDSRYLHWQYEGNPAGRAVEVDFRDGERLLAHMAGIPQRYTRTSGERLESATLLLLINIAIAKDARGRGLMMDLAQTCFAKSDERLGLAIPYGVPNASSTPGYTGRRLRFRWLRQLPVLILPPLWPSLVKVESADVEPAYLRSRAFQELASSIDFRPASLWSQQWSPELLAWRLGKPGRQYAIHSSSNAVIVTTTERHSGVPVCVIVKTFIRSGADRSRGNAIAAAACRFHRAPLALYAGFSGDIRFAGIPLPERFKPAPLNLVVGPSRPGYSLPDEFEFERFEFLDFDAF